MDKSLIGAKGGNLNQNKEGKNKVKTSLNKGEKSHMKI
ncbi:hypothetical protein CHCC14814_3088 [Bacillus paralicheniformis]|nr:hypothetical protein CHCC14814_3088 [Bacillus paralicheniformis]